MLEFKVKIETNVEGVRQEWAGGNDNCNKTEALYFIGATLQRWMFVKVDNPGDEVNIWMTVIDRDKDKTLTKIKFTMTSEGETIEHETDRKGLGKAYRELLKLIKHYKALGVRRK